MGYIGKAFVHHIIFYSVWCTQQPETGIFQDLFIPGISSMKRFWKVPEFSKIFSYTSKPVCSLRKEIPFKSTCGEFYVGQTHMICWIFLRVSKLSTSSFISNFSECTLYTTYEKILESSGFGRLCRGTALENSAFFLESGNHRMTALWTRKWRFLGTVLVLIFLSVYWAEIWRAQPVWPRKPGKLSIVKRMWDCAHW